jgi:hypothetical protein
VRTSTFGRRTAGATGKCSHPVRTTPDVWAQIIAAFVTEERFDTVNFVPATESPQQIARFATEVVPAAREILAGLRPRA